jgi:hypothetical protein
MDNNSQSPITATIVVEHHDISGVTATVDGRPLHLPDLQALFRTAVGLLERHPDHDHQPAQLELIPR